MNWTYPITAGLSAGMLLMAASPGAAADSSSTGAIDFNRDIRPVLSENCFACHGPDEKARKAKLRLDRKEDAFKEASSGETPIVPGAPERSELLRRITTADEDDRMPPAKSGKQLRAKQIDLLRRWIASGASWEEHWSYRKPVRPAVPEVRNRRWPRNEIDFFVLARLEKEKLAPSPEATRPTLIRRLSLDLTGLPPSIEEVAAFVNDRRTDAYEQLVDRLLASPHYGERWARPWLDQARYADSNGYEADQRRSIWPYREWVVQALNRDMPFDQFTVEQIAGDLLPDATRDQKIATGFHRNTMVNTEGGTDDEEFRVAAIVDRVNTTFEVWMGSTFGCAQCHTHKYDPFTQTEYYQVFAIFNQTRDKGRSNEPQMELPTPEQKDQRDRVREQIEPLEKVLNTQTPELDAAQKQWETETLEQASAISGGWKPLEADTVQADGGVVLEKLPDGSLLSSGATPEQSIYELEARTDFRGISALRLEALTDERLPQKSSGRSEEGDFVVTEFVVQAFPAGEAAAGPVEPPEFGPWHFLGPFQAGTVGEAFVKSFIAEDKIDLTQTYDNGRVRWTARPELKDGAVHPLSGENAATYLYRRIIAAEAMPLVISLGSDDGLQVWFNEKKILSREILRPVEPDQESLELQLVKGENRLLMKINNGSGDSGFYFATSADQSGVRRVRFERAYADFSMEKYEVEKAVDGNPRTGWAIAAHEAANRVDHHAVFVAKKPIEFEGGARLVIQLKQESERSQHLLGRFRLSLSTAPQKAHLAWGKVPAAVRTALVTPEEKRSEDQNKELAKHYRSIAPALDPVREQIAQLRKQEPKDIPSTLVLEAMDKPRATHLLVRGSHLNPGPEVNPGVPSVLPPLPAGEPTNRLTFARWLVHPENPLVGRVTMNRIWAQYFGIGLVETSEEFGSQGEPPTHPELLDWLASEFFRQDWSLKAMHRAIVNSAAYRQSSAVSPALRERDPFNRLLARGPHLRLEAEMIRDYALAVSGLLTRKIGGPSVYPYQPAGIWNSPYNRDQWPMSKDGDQFRRSIYTFWRRTAPYPAFMVFDAPSREVSCERRPRSNTPVQALATLNDPALFAAAVALGKRVMDQPRGSVRDRLEFAFRSCLARSPTAKELNALARLFEDTLRRYEKDPTQAKSLLTVSGLPKPDETAPLSEWAAWTVIANVLLNLDETLTKG